MGSDGEAVVKTKVFTSKKNKTRKQTTGGSRENIDNKLLLHINNEKENTINFWY